MKYVLLLLITFGLSGMACADGESVDVSKDVRPDGYVEIQVIRGRVKIRGWDKSEVRVTGRLDEQTEEFVFEVREEETQIRVKIPDNRNSWFSHDGSNLTIYVPATSQVGLSGVSTDVDVTKLEGAIEIGVVSGDIFIEGGSDRVEVQTVSGDIELHGSEGRLKIKSVSGEVESYSSPGEALYSTVSGDILVRDGGVDLRLESVSGDIEVQNDSLNTVRGHSVSGDILIAGKLAVDSTIEFDSVSGDIRLRLGGEISARFDIETGSGSIRNGLSDDKPKISKYMRDETLRFTLGDGDGHISITTRSGDIQLRSR